MNCEFCKRQRLKNEIMNEVLQQVKSNFIQAYAIGQTWSVGDLVGFDNTYWVCIKDNIGDAQNMPIGANKHEYWKNLSIAQA